LPFPSDARSERKAGAYHYWISRGVDNREVRANRVRKSVGAENTFSTDLTEFDAMVAELQPLIDNVWRHCEDKGARGRTVTLKVKFNDFEIITRSKSVPIAVSSRGELECLSAGLLQSEMPVPKPVRLLGISVSAFLAQTISTLRRPSDMAGSIARYSKQSSTVLSATMSDASCRSTSRR
jgi:nucleotidyltransferase/DNA polymerase involved in DNA repair